MRYYLTENKLTEEALTGLFIAAKDDSETRVSSIAQNSYEKLIAQVPKPATGIYRLQLSTGGSHLTQRKYIGLYPYGKLRIPRLTSCSR